MQEHYHIDVSEPGLLDRRSGRWLRVRIFGLLSCDSRLRAALAPKLGGGS
jgi:hypothetical protein